MTRPFGIPPCHIALVACAASRSSLEILNMEREGIIMPG
jgi:hypothetical protein